MFSQQSSLHRAAVTQPLFTQRRFYTQKFLHRSFQPQQLLRREVLTQRSFYSQTLLQREVVCTEEPLHTEAFTQRSCLHRGAFAHRIFCIERESLCAEELLQTEALKAEVFPQTSYYTQTPTHREAFAQRSLYRDKA